MENDYFPKFFTVPHIWPLGRRLQCHSRARPTPGQASTYWEKKKSTPNPAFPFCNFLCPPAAQPCSHRWGLYIWFCSLEISSLLIASLPSGTAFLIPAQENDPGPAGSSPGMSPQRPPPPRPPGGILKWLRQLWQASPFIRNAAILAGSHWDKHEVLANFKCN